MSEFGHSHATAAGTHLDSWGAGPFKIEMVSGGKSFLFEDSDRFGPVPLKKNGWEVKAPGYFAENSQFWYAWQKWRDQGRRLAEDRQTCIWSHDEPAIRDRHNPKGPSRYSDDRADQAIPHQHEKGKQRVRHPKYPHDFRAA
jgi:hypothetical protein